MKIRLVSLAIAAFAMLFLPAMASADSWILWDWSANIDGDTFNPPGLPASVNSAAFDFGTGLGSLVFSFNTAGPHYAGVYFSHYFDGGFGDVTDAYGAVAGSAPSGVTYQLGWPGEGSPTVFDNFAANALDGSNTVGAYSPPPNACCDVAIAEIREFTLNSGDKATLTYTVSPSTASPFYLQVTDHDSGNSIYLSQSYVYIPAGGGPTIPEPGTFMLTGAGIVLGLVVRRRMVSR
jgi:hypothetical protein